MGKQWSFKEDMFLAEYFDAIGDMAGQHDLGRPKGAATKRVKTLKKRGLWDGLLNLRRTQRVTRALHVLAFSKDSFAREIAWETLDECGVDKSQTHLPEAE